MNLKTLGQTGQTGQTGRTRNVRRTAAALVCACAITLAPTAALADSAAKEAGLGLASALASVLYAPVKIVYATGGLLVGGLAFAFSGGDSDVAKVVISPSVRGDYVITPAQLRGEKSIEFIGREPGYASRASHVASAGDDDEPLGW